VAFGEVIAVSAKPRVRFNIRLRAGRFDLARIDPIEWIALAGIWHPHRREHVTMIFFFLTALDALPGELHQKG
jgi:hypothetical protein